MFNYLQTPTTNSSSSDMLHQQFGLESKQISGFRCSKKCSSVRIYISISGQFIVALMGFVGREMYIAQWANGTWNCWSNSFMIFNCSQLSDFWQSCLQIAQASSMMTIQMWLRITIFYLIKCDPLDPHQVKLLLLLTSVSFVILALFHAVKGWNS